MITVELKLEQVFILTSIFESLRMKTIFEFKPIEKFWFQIKISRTFLTTWQSPHSKSSSQPWKSEIKRAKNSEGDCPQRITSTHASRNTAKCWCYSTHRKERSEITFPRPPCVAIFFCWLDTKETRFPLALCPHRQKWKKRQRKFIRLTSRI